MLSPSTLALTLGATVRLTRFVVADQLGEWLIHEPVKARKYTYLDHRVDRPLEHFTPDEVEDQMWDGTLYMPTWWKASTMLDCPWCVGYWVGAGVLAGSVVTTGTRAEKPWRFLLGTLSLNVVANAVAGLPGLDLYGAHAENTDD